MLRRLVGIVCFAAAVLIVVAAGLPDRRLDGQIAPQFSGNLPIAPEVGALAPPLMARTLSGEVFTLSFNGAPILLNFWASWCAPCLEEMPLLEAAHQAGVRVIGVNVGESAQVANEFIQLVKVHYPNLSDPDRYWAQVWQIRALPTTFFIGAEGVIDAVHLGALRADQLP